MDKKYNPLNPTDNNEKPLDPRQALDPVMQALRKRRKERLQRATHADAPPIFPDPMDAEMNEYREKPKGPDPEGADKDKPVFKMGMFKKQKENISKGKCPTCTGNVGEFRDTASEKEYKISGMCQNCQDRMFGEAVDDGQRERRRDTKGRRRPLHPWTPAEEEMFPTSREVTKLTKGMSHKQTAVFNTAMANKSSARKEWRSPSRAKRIAQRIADSILFEKDQGEQEKASLVKRPKLGGQPVSHLRTLKKSGALTGSDAYRRRSSHATLTRTQPHRFIEKMSSLVAAWRSRKTGQGRQVVKNLAVAPRRGREARKKFLATQAKRNK